VEKAEQRLEKIYGNIRPYFGTTNQPGQYEGRLVITTNHQALAVLGLRACQPALLAYEQAGQPFLIASFAPTLASTNPVPKELLAELNRPSLVAYEWEIAGESFIHWNVLFDFNNMVQRRMAFPRPEMVHVHRPQPRQFRHRGLPGLPHRVLVGPEIRRRARRPRDDVAGPLDRRPL
jgi:hypothetical protein